MAAILDKQIKREVQIEGVAYTLKLDGEGVTVVRKGARKGFTVTWASLVEGSPQRQLDLIRSLEAAQARRPVTDPDAAGPGRKRRSGAHGKQA